MSSTDVADCLAAERSFALEDDQVASVEMVLVCRHCHSEHTITAIHWPGNAEYHALSCCVCLAPLARVRCDVGEPLLSATIVAEQLRKNWRRVFAPFGRLGVVVP